MRFRTALLFFTILVGLASCKTYEVTSFKAGELSKIADISKYQVYLHAPKVTFQVIKPALSAGGLSGGLTHITDQAQIADLNDPKEAKKNKHNLNVFTKTEIADSTAAVALKKTEITEYNIVVVHSKVDVWEGIADGLGLAVSLAAVGAVVYWFTLNPW
jgi:hypothetical protein